MSELVEKPAVGSSPSNLAIAGSYILTPAIFKAIEKTAPGKNSEIQLIDAMRILLLEEELFSCTLEGRRYDIGNKLDYLKTTVEFALRRKEFAEPFGEFLNKILKN